MKIESFDVIAQAPAGSTREQMNLMLRALLADRFRLAVHNDTRELSALVMTVSKSGVKMKKSEGAGEGECASPPNDGQRPGPSYVTYVCRGMTMAAFANFLPPSAPAYFRATPLVDQTHLEGAWDFTIKWSPRGQVTLAGADGISLFDGVEKQLGLHIELGKAPLPVIVVDSVNEKPTENAPGVTAKLPQVPQEFEVAVIKPSAPGSTEGRLSFKNGRVDAEGPTLKDLITLAWDLGDDQIAGLPGFAANDRYDVTAKAPEGLGNDFDSIRAMLQALVKVRFKMRYHEERRSIDVLTLVASKPKLTKADPGNRSQCRNVASTSVVVTRSVECRNTTMAQFAAWLGDNAGGYTEDKPVVDETSLEGSWDFTLGFSSARAARGGAQSGDGGLADPNGAATLFDALGKLGLKLETAKRPMPVMGIDHIEERPTEN